MGRSMNHNYTHIARSKIVDECHEIQSPLRRPTAQAESRNAPQPTRETKKKPEWRNFTLEELENWLADAKREQGGAEESAHRSHSSYSTYFFDSPKEPQPRKTMKEPGAASRSQRPPCALPRAAPLAPPPKRQNPPRPKSSQRGPIPTDEGTLQTAPCKITWITLITLIARIPTLPCLRSAPSLPGEALAAVQERGEPLNSGPARFAAPRSD